MTPTLKALASRDQILSQSGGIVDGNSMVWVNPKCTRPKPSSSDFHIGLWTSRPPQLGPRDQILKNYPILIV